MMKAVMKVLIGQAEVERKTKMPVRLSLAFHLSTPTDSFFCRRSRADPDGTSSRTCEGGTRPRVRSRSLYEATEHSHYVFLHFQAVEVLSIPLFVSHSQDVENFFQFIFFPVYT